MPNKKSTKKPVVKKSSIKKTKVKKPAKKKVAVKKSPKKIKKAVNNIEEAVKPIPSVCRSCNLLPVGNIELFTLLLVLIFALTAVLVTSVHSLQLKDTQITYLQGQIYSQ